MPRFRDFVPQGVIPAPLLPFAEDFSIDEAALRSHLRDVAEVRGIAAITVNGHASEVHACDLEDQRRVLAVALDEVGDRVPVIAGVYADGSLEAARIARMAAAEGASSLLVFPPHSIGRGGGQSRPEMAVAHFGAIAAACDLPLIAFQYPVSGGYGYRMATLLRLAEEVATLRAIKDGCNDARLHAAHVETLQSLPRPLNVLTTHSAWLLASLTSGCNGLLSGSGSVIADLHVALFEAVRTNDLACARRIDAQIRPTAQCFYAEPTCDQHNRMKEALVLLGRLERAVVRPPLVKLDEQEIARIRAALTTARIRREGALLEAA